MKDKESSGTLLRVQDFKNVKPNPLNGLRTTNEDIDFLERTTYISRLVKVL